MTQSTPIDYFDELRKRMTQDHARQLVNRLDQLDRENNGFGRVYILKKAKQIWRMAIYMENDV